MNNIKKLTSFIIVLLVVLRNYQSPIIVNRLSVLLMIGLISVMAWTILVCRKKVVSNNDGYISFLIWIFVVYFVTLLFSDLAQYITFDYKEMTVVLLVSLIVIFFAQGAGDYIYLIKFYYFFAIAFAVFGIIQSLVGGILGVALSGKIPFLKLYHDASFFNLQGYWARGGLLTKVSSVFAEPAQFAQYIAPALVFSLFSNNGVVKVKKWDSVLFTMALLLSTSANGIIVCAFTWVYFYLDKAKKGPKYIFIGFLLSCLILLTLPRLDFLQKSLENVFVSNTPYTKADYRIYRGFELFYRLPLVNKLFGIGWGNLTYHIKLRGLTSTYDRSWVVAVEYLNALAGILIYTGLVGFVLFGRFYIKLFKKCSNLGKCCMLVFLALSISSDVLMNEMWVLYFTLVYASIKYPWELRKGTITNKSGSVNHI